MESDRRIIEQDMHTLVSDGLDTVETAMRFTLLSRAKLYRLMASGILPRVKIGRSVRIPHRALVALAADNLVRSETPTLITGDDEYLKKQMAVGSFPQRK